ncbi:Carbohydrate esterase family 4 protein [Mycena venus]|uniref:chitin deacetylase n=1 Tax=Mycena venus TaxID=2733690 RepID=A0A8H7CHF9_9AGAR|nr:Carbohydrate esterase family 4 protein [Mycena venus]
MLVLAALLALPLLTSASSIQGRHDDHSHTAAQLLPSTWFHDSEHPVHELFRRGDATDGVTYSTVGSQAWSAGYPSPWSTASSDANALPAAWVAALNDAVSRKVIPDVPIPKLGADGNPAYPSGDPNGPEICSGTYGCRIEGDIWDGPQGGCFDDGPADGTADLLSFLAEKNQRVTHFLIGSQIIYLPDDFTKMYNMGDDIAVHTWSHPYMTTQSNIQVVAELGWTLQLIHNSTGGRIPKFWRPPLWSTADWTLTESPPYTTPEKIQSQMKQWLTGPKSPGLIILEHELSTQSAAAFIAAYPLMQQNGWDLVSLASLVGNNVTYQNAASNTSPVTNVDIINAKNGAAGGCGSGRECRIICSWVLGYFVSHHNHSDFQVKSPLTDAPLPRQKSGSSNSPNTASGAKPSGPSGASSSPLSTPSGEERCVPSVDHGSDSAVIHCGVFVHAVELS